MESLKILVRDLTNEDISERKLLSIKLKALYKVCKINVDLPLPDTPVTHVKVPIGIFKFTFFKLFPVAPLISINLPFLALPLYLIIPHLKGFVKI